MTRLTEQRLQGEPWAKCLSGPGGNREGRDGSGYHFIEILDHRLVLSPRSLFGFDSFTG
jgi:hypothetical protein